MNSFQCLSLSPIELAHPGLAVATTRAGGVGVLDLEFCRNLGEDSSGALKNLETLLKLVPQAAVGLRLPEARITEKALLAKLSGHSHWLIFCSWQPSTIESAIASLPPSTTRKILLEVTDIKQIEQIPAVDGLIAKGHESGGWVGEDSAFVLTQKLITRQSLPVYVQGGIGIHTVAACRAAGAAGVVLDDQLWLMPESPLPQDWQRYLNNLNGQEAIVIGERLLGSCRVLSRPGFTAVANLQKIAKSLEIEDDPARLLTENPAPNQEWQSLAQPLIGWENLDFAFPMGQAVGLAVELRDRFSTTGRLIQALLKASQENLKIAQNSPSLAAGSPLAQSHGTKYPIVQGPMTRVSDSAEFANAVASGGALPLLALALMRGQQVRELLDKTKKIIGNKSWGIGILGFVPQAVRDEQLKEVLEVKPPFALIAGGRPDQAADLESQGIATYLHVPVPNLLKMFLEQGAKRFVFEGRECGGHVGPLSSFLLWESMISTLLEVVPIPPAPLTKGGVAAAEIHILFAGGIHDALSAAMVSAMSAPLVQRGIKVGVLMGSAYLFTEEAVSCGAIVKAYQEQAVACDRTINLETGTGHASRCAVTPFAQEFYATRRELLLSGTTPDQIKQTLEDLTLGRLRIASKGLVRQGSTINAVGESQQINDGMYMIGQVATLRDNVGSVEALHEAVSGGSAKLLNQLLIEEEQNTQTPSDIAIIGISTLVPKADYPETFWSNILHKVDAITEIPASRWDWRLYFDPDPKARDKVYSKWGGFLDDVAFDPLRFGIPPKSLKSIEPLQLLTLEAVRRALADAGLSDGNFDREMTSVILGAGGGLADLGQQYATRSEIPRFVETPNETAWQRLPEWTEESFPGLLLNVIAGRVANRFDFGGSNFTVDAACASSLAALDLAVRELESGRSNIAIAGGVDTVQTPFAYLCFSKTQALSPRGKCRTFDKTADGIAISEGIAIVVLKRLADAERDGDRIYGVIKSVASSSDGKALGMTAPLPAGQMRALNRAYNKAGFSPSTLGLYEAHGTGTVAGDRAELETIISTLQTDQIQSKTCALGSIKSMIGHTKSSAGIVGLIKATLALHHQTLPPHAGVDTPLDAICDPQSPVYLLKEAQPWLSHPDYPRRAGISAFGFGGTNFHAVLEEYQGNLHQAAPSSSNWSYELLVFNADSRENLVKELQTLFSALQAGAAPKLRDLAYSYAKKPCDQPLRLSLVVESLSQLKEALNLVLAYLNSPNPQPLPPYIQLNLAPDLEVPKTAFLFPGQGAQYPEMAREVALYFKEMRSALELADQHLGQRLSQFIYPPSAYSDTEQTRNQQQLTDTQIAQPAIGTVEVGYLDLLSRLGITADLVAGHSYGEYAALHAAGVLSREDFLKLSQTRGRVMSTACAAADGAMAAVAATREELLARLNGVENVVIANHNAPKQSVISGSKQAVRQVVDSLNVAQIMARMLPVAGAFHSSLVASAQVSLAGAIASTPMELPLIPVYANSTARPYEVCLDAIRDQLSQHLLSSVEFVGQINAMYDDGARIFLEVGPKSILSKLVGQILADKDHTVVSVDGHGGGLRGLLIALGTLAIKGVGINLTALFAGRDVQALDLSKLLELTHLPKLPATTWLINGGGARQMSEAVAIPNQLPPLSLEATQAQHTAALIEKTLLPRQEIKIVAETPNIPLAQEMPSQNFVQPTTALPMSTETGAFQANYQSTPTQDAALIAYQEYQQTMRQFLSLQEQVMMQFLGSSQQIVPPQMSARQIAPTPPNNARLVTPQTIPQPATNGNGNGKHNGNGVAPTPQPVPTVTQVTPTTVTTPVPTVNQIQTPIVAPVEVASTLPDKMQLTQMLLQLVSDRTGYPIDMLGLDQDLEAELGIDSIKRVEIMGALQKTLPQVAANIQSNMETLTRVKSLNGIVEQLQEASSLGKSNHTGSLSGAT